MKTIFEDYAKNKNEEINFKDFKIKNLNNNSSNCKDLINEKEKEILKLISEKEEFIKKEKENFEKIKKLKKENEELSKFYFEKSNSFSQ